MDNCIKNHKYVTPRFDTERLPVRYVALYEKGKGISRYGEVKCWKQTEQSHVFDVLEWQLLKEPISILEYGPSPIAYTNFFLLTNSTSYSELFLKNEEEYRFFAGLKRMTEEAMLMDKDTATTFEFEGIKVSLDNKCIHIENYDGVEKEYTVQEFIKHPNRTLKHLQSYAKMLREQRKLVTEFAKASFMK